MPLNFDSPDNQINKDIALRTGGAFFGNNSAFDPKLFVNEPKNKTQAAVMANRTIGQTLDAVQLMTKVNHREFKRLKFNKKNIKGKLLTRSKVENIIQEWDIRSRSIDHQAVILAAQTMAWTAPLDEKKKQPKNIEQA